MPSSELPPRKVCFGAAAIERLFQVELALTASGQQIKRLGVELIAFLARYLLYNRIATLPITLPICAETHGPCQVCMAGNFFSCVRVDQRHDIF